MRARIVVGLAVGWVMVGSAVGGAAEGDKAAGPAAPVVAPAPPVVAPAPPVTAPAPPAAAAAPTIPGNRAGDYVGQQVVIEGRVTAVHESPLATVLAFAQNFAGFTATIQAADREKFPADLGARIRDRVVRVTGTVTAYRGKPEMALKDPAQLALAAPSPGAITAPALPVPAPAVSTDGSLEEVRRALARIEGRLEDMENRLRDLEDATTTAPADVAEARPRSLTVGTGAAEVRGVLGEPMTIVRNPNGESWNYGRGRTVTFDPAGRVTAWTGF